MKKVLIVHASKTGTTKDAAAMIAKQIPWPCDIYDCCTASITQVNGETQSNCSPCIAGYDTVVIGTRHVHEHAAQEKCDNSAKSANPSFRTANSYSLPAE